MKTLPFIYLITSLLLWSCHRDSDPMITADLKSPNTFLESRKVYLKNWHTRQFVDSAVVMDGKFAFYRQAHGGGFPFRASIYYETRNPDWPHRPIGFRNPIHKNYGESTLYAEPGTMELVLDTIVQRGTSEEVIFRMHELGEQTRVAFEHPMFKTGAGVEDLRYNKNLIARHPTSIELLETLFLNRTKLDTAQLRQLAGLFAPELHSHETYQQTTAYLNVNGETGEGFPNKQLAITSISLDKQESAWRKALKIENMPWQQLLVADAAASGTLDRAYDLSAIPVWILLDVKGKLLRRHAGYQEGEGSVEEEVKLLLLDGHAK